MKRRVMARPIQTPRGPRWREAGAVGVVVVLAVGGLIAGWGILGGAPSATPTGSTRVAGAQSSATPTPIPASATLRTGAGAGTGVLPRTAPPSPTPGPTDEPTNSPNPVPTPGLESGAPTSPAEFDLEGQRISIGFPLRTDSQYRYRDNFLDLRDGSPDPYNHARLQKDGTATRLHDGTDIYAREGEPLVAPFSGMVIAARSRWQPWEPDRYGNTIVIVSDEPTSAGYLALFAHANQVWVDPGTHVTRGQVVGTVGRTGNAELQSVRPHLHIELRAPFLLDWSLLGEDRAVDAFNPYPSLVGADPKRT